MSPWQAGLLLAFLVSAALAWLFWRRARTTRARTGLPAGEVVYADTEGWEACPPLYARRWALAGKPDYLLRVAHDTIPVEVKPGRRAEQPYEGDVLQLAAYCLLVEENEGHAPPHGLLRYRDVTFRIPYDAELRQRLLETLSEMRSCLHAEAPDRDHDESVRCHFCGHRAVCDQRLVD